MKARGANKLQRRPRARESRERGVLLRAQLAYPRARSIFRSSPAFFSFSKERDGKLTNEMSSPAPRVRPFIFYLKSYTRRLGGKRSFLCVCVSVCVCCCSRAKVFMNFETVNLFSPRMALGLCLSLLDALQSIHPFSWWSFLFFSSLSLS